MIDGAYQLHTGTIIVPDRVEGPDPKFVVYARVSSSENRPNLDSQAERLVQYCTARGWKVSEVVKEVGSGLNDKRPKLLKILGSNEPVVIVAEHKDRLTRFGFQYIDTLLKTRGSRVELVNEADDGKEDLVEDFVAVITSFCARLYGQRRSKRKTERLIEELGHDS